MGRGGCPEKIRGIICGREIALYEKVQAWIGYYDTFKLLLVVCNKKKKGVCELGDGECEGWFRLGYGRRNRQITEHLHAKVHHRIYPKEGGEPEKHFKWG